jgi:putative glycosyltransferase (TIGR04348 family)
VRALTGPLHIGIVTPARRGARAGNRVTAERWARILRSLGHRVRVDTSLGSARTDLLVALHARRSAGAIRRFRARAPHAPVVLALTGTDVYGDLGRSTVARRSLALATRLVVLQPLALENVPAALRPAVRVIHQSVAKPARKPHPETDFFQVCVLGHLRRVKDPFRAAKAARRLPPSSTIRVLHAGRALGASMAERAREEMRRNPRYRWLGDMSRDHALHLLARSRLLVLTSRAEGGANVVSEALAWGVPVLASKIPGTVGLLGPDYPGYFEVGDTRALATLLDRAETEPDFLESLQAACQRRTWLVDPVLERRAWRALLAELTAGRATRPLLRL